MAAGNPLLSAFYFAPGSTKGEYLVTIRMYYGLIKEEDVRFKLKVQVRKWKKWRGP